MSDWHQQYEDAAKKQANRFARWSDRELLDAIRRRETGDYYVIWYELAKRTPTAEMCWLLYEVLRSDRPYLDKYHCAAALLTLLRCTEFEEVELSADWPVVPANLAKLRGIIEARFGPLAQGNGSHVSEFKTPSPKSSGPPTQNLPICKPVSLIMDNTFLSRLPALAVIIQLPWFVVLSIARVRAGGTSARPLVRLIDLLIPLPSVAGLAIALILLWRSGGQGGIVFWGGAAACALMCTGFIWMLMNW